MIAVRESLDGFERELITETLEEMFDLLEYLDGDDDDDDLPPLAELLDK